VPSTIGRVPALRLSLDRCWIVQHRPGRLLSARPRLPTNSSLRDSRQGEHVAMHEDLGASRELATPDREGPERHQTPGPKREKKPSEFLHRLDP
jgi:hypothetical protein